MEKIEINSEYYLSAPHEGDISSFVKHLNDKDIYDRTLNIPFPYTEVDAKQYLDICNNQRMMFGHILSFAIRNKNGELIGAIGFHGKNMAAVFRHKDEIGYWLAKEYRNKGIMTAALPVMIKYGEEVRGLKRFEAPVFSFNVESEKLLLKCGFKQEGIHEKAYLKNGEYIDAKLFALVK
jgi:[ribosomal protein S5]-alanine N-acetyltransferase